MAARGEPPLSDSELRTELKKVGFNPGPITASTRGLLLKKLQRLQDEEKKKSRKTPASKVSSPKIFSFSSDDSDGETAGNSRGTAPVSSSRRRSGARTAKPAPSKTTKRLSVGGKASQSTKKTGSRRSLAVVNNDTDEEPQEEENNSGRNDVLDDAIARRGSRLGRTGVGIASRSTNSSNSSARLTPGRRSERGAGDTRSSLNENSQRDQSDLRGEYSVSESEDEILNRRVVKNKVTKSKTVGAQTSSRTRTPARASVTSRKSTNIRPENSKVSHQAEDDDDDDEEEDEEDSASDNSGKRDTFVVRSNSSPKAKEDSGSWGFLTRRRNPSPRTHPEPVNSNNSKDDTNNTTGNWTFFTSRFNSSRTSTPRKASPDDTVYHSIAGNSTRQDASAHSVATPISGRPTLRGSTLDATPSNHASFAPSMASSAPRHPDPTPNRSQSNMEPDASQASFNEHSVDEAQTFATEENLVSTWRTKYGHCVSWVLLGSACLFFIVLGLIYLSVNSTGKTGYYLQIADLAGDDVDYSGDDMPLKMAQIVHDKLSQLAGDFVCGKADVKNMTMVEATIFLEEDSGLRIKNRRNPFWVVENLPKMKQLIITNPQWGLKLFRDNGELITEYDYDDTVQWLESSHLYMTMFCQVKTTMMRLLFWTCVLIVSLLVLWPCVFLFKYQMQRKEQQRQEVTKIVEKIIEVLANHQQACYKDKSLTPYLAIPHVRDTLIPPADRHKKQHLWEQAVQFLNVNESRVRVETQQVAGEEFAVWRWVQPSPAVAVTSFSPITERDMNPKRAKVWQGTAFANLDTAVKPSAHSYTPCLKVRNMFDLTLESGSNWHVTIQDAILDRCGENNGIVHIAVDSNSREGCVYVKCMSSEKAGMAFRCLQGSWFDGRLVTVKYIRLDRYHQRFPSALSAMHPLRPSNNLRVSLQPLLVTPS